MKPGAQSGKLDYARPLSVSKQQYDANYARIFGSELNGEEPVSKTGKARKRRAGSNPVASVIEPRGGV